MFDNTEVFEIGDIVKPTYPMTNHPIGMTFIIANEDACHYFITHDNLQSGCSIENFNCLNKVPKRCVYHLGRIG